jgi:hypothetical protein
MNRRFWNGVGVSQRAGWSGFSDRHQGPWTRQELAGVEGSLT